MRSGFYKLLVITAALFSFSVVAKTIKYPDGGVYKGDTKKVDGKHLRHGQGFMTYASGATCDCQWQNDNINGQGKLIFSSGEYYLGGFVDNQFDGQGGYFWTSGESYKGLWKKGKRNGFGYNEIGPKNYYLGNYLDNLKHGHGERVWPNGDKYNGFWAKDVFSGEGKFQYSNGDVYSGSWFNSKRHGRGMLTKANGETYTGEWQNDKYDLPSDQDRLNICDRGIIGHEIAAKMKRSCTAVSKKEMAALTELRLSDLNTVTSISSSSFQGLHSLQFLELYSFRNLNQVDPNTFSELKKLKKLHLWITNISQLDIRTFEPLSSLESMHLGDSPIRDLPPELFRPLTSLKKLSLGQNGLQEIPSEALKELPKLEEVSFLNNRISNIKPQAFEGLNNLKRLDFSGNRISEIEPNTFENLKSLEEIGLWGNNLTNLKPNAFAGLPSLKKLDIENNKLQHMPTKAELGLHSDVSVKFAKNDIKTPPKFGSLAVDRDNGFFYGWANDQVSQQAAEQRAMNECVQRGGNCSIVLTWSGAGAGVYRTVEGQVGTSYGWGVADTKEEADLIASRECAQRSNSNLCRNHVWSENKEMVPLSIIYDASPELLKGYKTVRIGSQIWLAENWKGTTFRNGDPIIEATTDDEFFYYDENQIPAFIRGEYKSKGEIFYNQYVMWDKRGFAPKGWKVPDNKAWQQLQSYLGGQNECAMKLKKQNDWPKESNTNVSGFSAKPFGSVQFLRSIGTGTEAVFLSTDYIMNTRPWVKPVTLPLSYIFIIFPEENNRKPLTELNVTHPSLIGASVRFIKE